MILLPTYQAKTGNSFVLSPGECVNVVVAWEPGNQGQCQLSATKVEFQKLSKIGITSQEVKSIIGKELQVIFFIPLVFGSFAGVSIICLVTNMVGGGEVLQEFLENTSKIIAFYFFARDVFIG